MTPEGVEPPTFGSGIRRATIAPWSQAEGHPAGVSSLCVGHGYVTRLAGLSVEPQWRNWTAHQTSNLGVAGSSPAWGIIFDPTQSARGMLHQIVSTLVIIKHDRPGKWSDGRLPKNVIARDVTILLWER